MKVLSLFDGIGCLRNALHSYPNIQYWASEIDENAIKIHKKNYPSSIFLGDVKDISGAVLDNIGAVDLLCGGSPCVDLSIAKKERKGLEGQHSKLFYEFVRILKDSKPKYFIFENVASMPKKDMFKISEALGVMPIMINASLVSAQSRKRLFWTNIPNIQQPTDRKIFLKDILSDSAVKGISIRGRKDASGNYVNQTEVRKDDKASALTSTCSSKLALVGRLVNRRLDSDGKRHDGDHAVPQTQVFEERTDSKSGTLTNFTKDNMVLEEGSIRKLTPIECERLMGLPDDYTEGIAVSARYRALGNGFSVPVIRHILSYMECPHKTTYRGCPFCMKWEGISI
jgi:DNA (cytosine-5)-methyltransferase 3A